MCRISDQGILKVALPEPMMKASHILCVDDDPHIRELNEIVLGRAGYEVACASSPVDALEKLKSGAFDLVVTDLFSSESSDLEFIAKMRAMAPGVPIIVVSGTHNPPPEILKQTDAFVAKAYSLNALTDAVREVLMREKLRRIG